MGGGRRPIKSPRAFYTAVLGFEDRNPAGRSSWLTVVAPDQPDGPSSTTSPTTTTRNGPTGPIGRKPPATIWKQTPKTGPADRPLTTPTSIHRVAVTGGICHINKTYSITIGAAHTGQQATVIITGPTCNVFIAGRFIRQLTLDPTRYQPLYDRPGRP